MCASFLGSGLLVLVFRLLKGSLHHRIRLISVDGDPYVGSSLLKLVLATRFSVRNAIRYNRQSYATNSLSFQRGEAAFLPIC